MEVLLDGVKKKEVRITRDNLFTFDGTLTLEGKAVTGGQHILEVRRRGRGPGKTLASLSSVSSTQALQSPDPIPSCGHI
jgi:hypothetical protein